MYFSTLFLFLGDLGGGEMFVILTAVLLLFGADKIPGIARSFGRGIREFKDATNEIKQELEQSIKDDPKSK
ncbi:sec-independent protein translocase protein TatA [Pontibacter ummariensis]|uniref:Sec-independent protein translocase protein TatA n=1 Tax=Pontibacter ummariensis TaxID=1610492 RepID=A0A239HUW2_9BACT|nr:twin-arginine translocase TatA/TatE family subunit [Pontibacter ummariensis]PRY10426.1 sec-independent protein translocase protein TatA [Pontibacter ummariensis]SNS84523.1 sec-independent protein translocase protein TatA [Pontibacter ummariensis]